MVLVDSLNLEQIAMEFERASRTGDTKYRGVTISIPVRNEDPKQITETFEKAINANMLSYQKYQINEPPIKSIYLSDQSGKEARMRDKELLEDMVRDRKAEFKRFEHFFPNVRFLEMGENMRDHILADWSDVKQLDPLVDHIKERNEVSGKGLNMYLFALTQEQGPILYIDSDDRNRKSRGVLALSLPLSHMKYDAVLGTFDRYHKDKFGTMERGGRVNAGTRAIFDMVTDASHMKYIGYPLCGDQGFSLDILRALHFPMTYGVETSNRFQLHSHVNGFSDNSEPLLANRRSLQVDIEGNDDEPIGEGKSTQTVMKKVSDMAREVAEAAFASINMEFLMRYKSSIGFMKEFERYQDRALTRYQDRCISQHQGRLLDISGGITDTQLQKLSYDAVHLVATRFYENPLTEQERLRDKLFLPPLNSLKTNLGPDRYCQLRDDIKQFEHNLSEL